MAESQTVTILRAKREEIAAAILNYERQLENARADFAHITAALAIFDAGDKPGSQRPYKPSRSRSHVGRRGLCPLKGCPLCAERWQCAVDYQTRISGPLFDRIDLHVEVPGVAASDLALPAPREGSAEVAARVARARDIQRARFEGETVRTNAEAEGELLDRVATPEPGGIKLLTEAAGRMRLSARGYSRVLRVARTIADLAGAPTVLRPHIAEALSYRRLALQN
jgi:hypothetical protein